MSKKKYQIALRRLYSTNYPCDDIVRLLGIDKYGFIDHINSYCLNGMALQNFGSVWGLDHIVPVELFDLSNDDDLLLCYNYNNIIPMFNSDNLMKGGSVHFSLLKLERMPMNLFVEQLKLKCANEIEGRYNKYLI